MRGKLTITDITKPAKESLEVNFTKLKTVRATLGTDSLASRIVNTMQLITPSA